jgi:WD40 repeat protein
MKKTTVSMLAALVVLLIVSIQNSKAQTQSDESYQLYLTQIAASEAYLQLNLISTAQNYLESTNEKHRDIEWRFLKAALDQSQNAIAKQSSNYYTDVKISSDGKTVAAASSDSLITLFSYPGLKKAGELKSHNSPVSTLDFSGNGKLLVSGGRDHAVVMWNIETGKMVWKNDTSFLQGIYQVRFSPGDSLVGVVSWERIPNRPPGIFGFAKLLDAKAGKELLRVELDNHPAAGIVFTPDGKNMILSSWGEIAYSYNLTTGGLNWKFDLSDPQEYNAFHSIDINPAGDVLTLGSTDHRVYLLNPESGEILHKIEPWQGHKKTIKAVKFSADGQLLATAGEDQTIFIWNATDWSKLNNLKGHINTVNGLVWTGDGNIILSASLDGTLREWDVKQPFELNYEICDFGPWQTPFSRDGKYFAAPSSDKKMMVYEVSTGDTLVNLGEQSGLCGVFSDDEKTLVTSSFDGIVREWDLKRGTEIRALKGHSARVDGISYLSKSHKIISVGDTTLRVWNSSGNSEEKILPFADSPFRATVTSDESKAIVAFNSGMVKVFETVNWTELATFQCETSVQEMDVSTDGKTMAFFSGKNIELWNLETFSRSEILAGHEKSGYGIGFSPDGKYLITGSNDQTFKLWNLEKMTCTLTFHGYEDTIYNCKILSENEIFLSSSQGGIWYYRFE